MMAVVSWMILPGLADLMRPKKMEEGEVGVRGGGSLLGLPRREVDGQPPVPTGGGGAGRQRQHPPSTAINGDGFLSKALQLVLRKLDAEGEGKDDPVKEDVKKIVAEKYCITHCGKGNATNGLEGWQGTLEGGEGEEQSRLFGADPVFIDEDVLAAV
jgi:hypothetical protein